MRLSKSFYAVWLTCQTLLLACGCCSPDFALAEVSVRAVHQSVAPETKWSSEPCPKARWQPSEDEFRQIIEKHKAWLANKRTGDGRAQLCNAVLTGKNAQLVDVNLDWADLRSIQIVKADFRNVSMASADLRKARLNEGTFSHVSLVGANADGTWLVQAKLTDISLFGVSVRETNFSGVDAPNLNWQDVEASSADFSSANLAYSNVAGGTYRGAKFKYTKLDGSNFTVTDLSNSWFVMTSVAGVGFSNVNFSGVIYAPLSGPPSEKLAALKGLSTIRLVEGEEGGFVQLRAVLQRVGLRSLEREATYSLERARAIWALENWKFDLIGAIGAVVRFIAFDITTGYGLYPSRAILALMAVWAILIPLYAFVIIQQTHRSDIGGVYLVMPKERIAAGLYRPKLEKEADASKLKATGLNAWKWASLLSLLSAFNIGFREINVGTWISRLQSRPFTLECLGWVRVVSGLQALFSVYFLALWIFTYFGRPFD